MRKYNRLKERYYETDFIDDNDQKAVKEVPWGLPKDIPVDAWVAYVNFVGQGYASLDAFLATYKGPYEVDKFIEEYYKNESIDIDTFKSVSDDPFFHCVDLYSLGDDLCLSYEEELGAHPEEDNSDILIKDTEEEESKEKRRRRILHNLKGTTKNGFEAIAEAYIKTISELEGIPFRNVILNNEENYKKYIDYSQGQNDIFDPLYGDYFYADGYVFSYEY